MPYLIKVCYNFSISLILCRYTYIVHPLAYRDSTNKLPDCSVDAMQWSIINILKEKNLKEKFFFETEGHNPASRSGQAKKLIEKKLKKGEWSKCHGLEIFNDFTYTNSYNSELQLTPVDKPDFAIPCLNGGTMHFSGSESSPNSKPYTWWFDTYPLEYAEFLLVTALSHGVWLHPLAANDVGYQRIRGIAEQTGVDETDGEKTNTEEMEDCLALIGDSKSSTLKKMGTEKIRKYVRENSVKITDIPFYKGLPYGTNAAFGFTTLIDSEKVLKNEVEKVCLGHNLAADEEYPCNMSEITSLQYLIKGKIYILMLGVNPIDTIHDTSSEGLQIVIGCLQG